MPDPKERTHRPRRPEHPVSRRLGSLRRSQRRQTPSGAADPSVSPPAHVKRRLAAVLHTPGRGQVIAAVILFVVGLVGVMLIRSNAADDTYRTARREDLIQLLDGLSTESRRLENEIAELEQTVQAQQALLAELEGVTN